MTRILLSLALTAVLAGCGLVTNGEIEAARAVCADNGGLKHVILSANSSSARCVNGALFSDIRNPTQ